MEFSPAVVEQFTKAFEKVSGVAHVARSSAEIPEIVRKVAEERNAKCVAMANLSEELSKSIASAFDSNMDIMNEPYEASALPGTIDRANVGVTGIAFGIAQTGTLVEIATNDAVRLVSALPRTHIGVVHASDLVAEYDEAAPRVRALFNDNPTNCVVSFLSGPSRTGDIELKLQLGVHGPESAHAIVVLG